MGGESVNYFINHTIFDHLVMSKQNNENEEEINQDEKNHQNSEFFCVYILLLNILSRFLLLLTFYNKIQTL